MTKKENRIKTFLAVFMSMVLLFAWSLHAAAVQGTEEDTVQEMEDEAEEEQPEKEIEGEDIPDEEPDYGNESGTVIFRIGKHGTAKIDGKTYTSDDSGMSQQYDAGTKVTVSICADTGYSIDEIYVLDEQGSYLEYVVGFDTDSTHCMSFQVYGDMTQKFYVDFAAAEKDEFAGAEGTIKFRTTTDTSLSRIDGGHVYRSENGDLAYCGDASKHAPDTDGLSMKLDKNNANQSAYDYIMYYGYPKHTTILGTQYSAKDAHDITQWAIWLIMNPSYNRGTFRANPSLSSVSKKLAASAGKYDGSNAKINGSAFVYYPSSSKRQPMVIANLSNTYGKLKLSKSSSNASATDGNSYYSLIGADYAVYSDAACKNRVAALTTKASGNTSTVELATGVYYVKEVGASPGYTINSEIKKVTIKENTTTTLKVKETPGTGKLTLTKKSENTTITAGNSCYSLSGAEYTVFTDRSCMAQAKDVNKNAAILTTKADGTVDERELYFGKYYVKETKAAKGYALDSTIYEVEIAENGRIYQVNGKTVEEVPQAGYPEMLLEKVDLETAEQKAQGAASLAGAEFTVKYYDGFYSESEAQLYIPKRTWKFQTDESGQIKWTDDPVYFLGGDPMYYDTDGKPVIPLGTVTIVETKEPEGYLADASVKKIEIVGNGTVQKATVKNNATGSYAFQEQIRRGDIQIMKYGENRDDNYSGARKALEGVIFTLTSETTGESWTIATDENGIATTKSLNISERGNLVYDTYTVEETVNPYSEYDKTDVFEVILEPTAEEDGKTCYYGIVNMEIYTPIQVVKTDASTGKIIPVAGTEFQILDQDKNVMELTITQYPKKITATSFVTDESGTFTFPELFDYGTYYLKEVQAPEGYACSAELLEITVDELHGWEEPLVIAFSDENAMGQIELTKVDAETKETLAGAEFTVRAAEDIVTPDGTLRCRKGETADVFTTNANGYGCSEELFLGKYTVEETAQPQGYILDLTVYGVELTYENSYTPLVRKNLGEISNKPLTEHKDTQDEEQTAEVENVPEQPEEVAIVDAVPKSTPKTGDDTYIWIYVLLAGAAGIVISGNIYRTHRKRKRKK